MYTAQDRAMLEATLINLAGNVWGDVKRLSEAEIETIINTILKEDNK